ncbi:MAG TPA: glycosyltransferase family 2 protein [Polyangiaceae bacterium]
MQIGFLIPAYQAERSIAAVVHGLRFEWARVRGAEACLLCVVDDGSSDRTAEQARAAGAELVQHVRNLGKGAALSTGFRRLQELGAETVVAVDADGQHPPEQAVMLAQHPAPASALLLGVRDLEAAGAPRMNRFSNRFSNRFLSWASGHALADTQCGLRRYPLVTTIELGVRAAGYGFEAEVILRALRRGLSIVEVPVTVIYPPPSERVSHFHAVRDPAKIVYRVLHTLATARHS